MPQNTPKPQEKAPEMTSEAMRTELETGLEDVKNRERTLNSQEVINTNKLKETKTRVIQTLFGVLEDFGVDPSNLESINAFLSQLRNQDPDLAQLFEVAFNDLTGEPESAEPEVDAGLMNKFKNLGPETMMPRETPGMPAVPAVPAVPAMVPQ